MYKFVLFLKDSSNQSNPHLRILSDLKRTGNFHQKKKDWKVLKYPDWMIASTSERVL